MSKVQSIENIDTIEDLICAIGEKKVKQLFLEYALLSINKAERFNKIASAVYNKNCIVDDIQAIVENKEDLVME